MLSHGFRLGLHTSSGLRCYNHFLSRSLNPQNYFQTSTVTIRQCSSKPSIIGSIFGRRKRKKEAEAKAKEAEDEIREAEENYEKDLDREKREEKLMRLRNKSKLNASDRRILKGQYPYVGVVYEGSDMHREPHFKAEMLAKFGRETGIDPSVAWPTKAQLEEEREHEQVFYDGLTLKQMMDNVRQDKLKKEQEIVEKEKEFEKQLILMKKDLKTWRVRIESKNKAAEKDRQRREKILAELKLEYGYAVNPYDPQFAEKIAAKEKEYSKIAKEEKKKSKAERTILNKEIHGKEDENPKEQTSST